MKGETRRPGGTEPLACIPDAIPEELRADHFDRAFRLFAAVLERRELPDGFAYRLPQDSFDEVARFVGNERRCCPFLRLEIELPPNGVSLELRLTGPPGTRELLESELPDVEPA